MRSIFIATWGNPFIWSPVEYRYEGRSVENRSSLPLLLECVDPKPDQVLVIVLDTVAKEPISSYNNLLDHICSLYSDFINERIGVDLKKSNLSILVAPGVGRFKIDGNVFIRFDGNLSDFYAYILFRLSKIFLDCDDEVVVHLDLSHGINFMPSLTLAAIRELLSALSLTSNVRLKIYNSEPYVNREVTRSLTIHLVEDREITPILDIKPLGVKGECMLLKARMKNLNSKKQALLKSMRLSREELNEINAFISSIFNGLPLALYSFYPEDLNEKLNYAVKLWMDMINIIREGGEISVVREFSFSEDFVRCVIINFIATTLKLSRKREVTLDDLDILRRKFFSKWSKKLDIMISFDLRNIKEAVSKYPGMHIAVTDWVKLHEIFGEKPGGFDVRNFLAHSGLEQNITEMKIDGSTVKLRYAGDFLKREVINGCLNGLLKKKY
jgi:CRISPR-associated protein Csx1